MTPPELFPVGSYVRSKDGFDGIAKVRGKLGSTTRSIYFLGSPNTWFNIWVLINNLTQVTTAEVLDYCIKNKVTP